MRTIATAIPSMVLAVPDALLSAWHTLTHFIFTRTLWGVTIIVIPILQVRKLRHRDRVRLEQGSEHKLTGSRVCALNHWVIQEKDVHLIASYEVKAFDIAGIKQYSLLLLLLLPVSLYLHCGLCSQYSHKAVIWIMWSVYTAALVIRAPHPEITLLICKWFRDKFRRRFL